MEFIKNNACELASQEMVKDVLEEVAIRDESEASARCPQLLAPQWHTPHLRRLHTSSLLPPAQLPKWRRGVAASRKRHRSIPISSSCACTTIFGTCVDLPAEVLQATMVTELFLIDFMIASECARIGRAIPRAGRCKDDDGWSDDLNL